MICLSNGRVSALGLGFEVEVGDFQGQGLRVYVRAVREDDHGQIVFGETLDARAEAYGFAVMPHSGVSFVGIEEPSETVLDGAGRGIGGASWLDGC